MPYHWLNDGTPLHYTDEGSGAPLVMLHGLMYSARCFWKPNIAALARQCRVMALDMRGQGESGKPNFGYSIAGLANDLREFLAARAPDGAVVVGVALGGLVLLDYLRRFGPERIRAIAIVDMTPRLVSAPGWPHATFGEFPQAAAEAFGAQVLRDRSGLRSFLENGFAGPADPAQLEEMLAESFLTPTHVVAELVDDMVRQDFRDFLPQIRLPTLLLYGGERNKILPTRVGRWVAGQIRGSELVEFEHSGHYPFLEEPERFNAALLRFAAKAHGSGRS